MQVRVLGELEIVLGGDPVDLGGPKPRALLALLVAAEGRPVQVEHLIGQIWGEQPPARVDASLQSYVARLRRALEPDRDAGRVAQRLRTHTGGYSLDVDAEAVDARRFVSLVRRARTAAATEAQTGTGADEAIELLTEALGLWRGPAYTGLPSPALEAEATRLEELRMSALVELWQLRLGRGDHGDAVAELEQLTRLHPLREQLWALLALALYRSSRQAEALAALRRVREGLADELGVDPGPELRRLEQAILNHDPALDPRPSVPGASPASARRHDPPAERAPEPERQPEREPEPETEPETEPDPPDRELFGRTAALAEAAGALAACASGRGRTILVTGEPGIGKTRFTEALVAHAASTGYRVGRGGWEPEACPPLWGWTRALTQLLGHAEPLLSRPDDVTDAASASFRQADALLAALGDGPPALIVLDDVHWADAESLRLLRRVAAQLHAVPAVLVVALRSAPADIGDALADALAALARLDPLRVELAGLDAAAVGAYVVDRAGVGVPRDVVAELVERTEGNPFYLTELVRLLVSEGALSDPRATAWRTVPHGVRDVVRQRLASVSGDTVGVLTAAAVTGRSFDLPVLEDVVGDKAAVEVAVETAQVLGLVDEEAPGRFRFTHALVREAVRETLAAPSRARTHAAVAAALERLHGGRIDEHVVELAEHYRLAGPAYVRSAWVFARKAGERAAGRSAHDEALRLFTSAASLQEQDPTVEPVEREQVLLGRVRALTRLARPLEAWAPAAQAARSALGRDDASGAAAALLAITDGMVWGWRSHPEWDDDAIALWQEVLARQPREETLTRAHLTAAIGVEHLYRPGSADHATRLADSAVAMVRQSGRKGYAELQVLRLAQMALLRPDLLHHRAPLSDEIVSRSVQVGDPSGIASALTGRAQDRAELGRLADAFSDVVRAHDLAQRHHLSQNWMVSGWCLALRRQLEEQWVEAEQLVSELEAFQATLAMAGVGIGLAQLANLRDLTGRLPELEPVLRESAPFHPALRELHALALVRAGALDELRMRLGPYPEQPAFSFDYMWVPFMAVRAEVWCALGDAEAAADLYAQLTPYADRLAISVPVAFRGSVQLTLGRLAAVCGDSDAARDHLSQARRVHADLGLGVWVERTEAELARLAAAVGR